MSGIHMYKRGVRPQFVCIIERCVRNLNVQSKRGCTGWSFIWLRYAGKATRAADDLDAWRECVEMLREDHYRKYKLRPMLDDLLDEF